MQMVGMLHFAADHTQQCVRKRNAVRRRDDEFAARKLRFHLAEELEGVLNVLDEFAGNNYAVVVATRQRLVTWTPSPR